MAGFEGMSASGGNGAYDTAADEDFFNRERKQRQSIAFGANLLIQAMHRTAADRQRQRDDVAARTHLRSKLRRRR